jgi:hypothetical protein
MEFEGARIFHDGLHAWKAGMTDEWRLFGSPLYDHEDEGVMNCFHIGYISG